MLAVMAAGMWVMLPGWLAWDVLTHRHIYDGTTGAPAGVATWLDFWEAVGAAAFCTAMCRWLLVLKARQRGIEDLGQSMTAEERAAARWEQQKREQS